MSVMNGIKLVYVYDTLGNLNSKSLALKTLAINLHGIWKLPAPTHIAFEQTSNIFHVGGNCLGLELLVYLTVLIEDISKYGVLRIKQSNSGSLIWIGLLYVLDGYC